MAPDSNYGMTTVDLSAPGEKLIWSTGYRSGAEAFSGTSAAEPLLPSLRYQEQQR